MTQEGFIEKISKLDMLEKILLGLALITMAVLIAPYLGRRPTSQQEVVEPASPYLKKTDIRSNRPTSGLPATSRDHGKKINHKLSEIEGLLE